MDTLVADIIFIVIGLSLFSIVIVTFEFIFNKLFNG